MNLNDLQGKMVAVIGFGQEGQATAAYLKKHQIPCVLFDQRPLESFSKELVDQLKSGGQHFIFGPDSFKELTGFGVAFRSPGIPLTNSELVKAQQMGLEITSQTKFFFDNCPGQIIGVTGTKGKGTTSTLIYKTLLAAGKKAFLTGNIGEVQGFEILDQLTQDNKVVFELSSFQLQDLSVSPHVGVVLMVTSDHLDYHGDVSDYRSAKEAIVKYQKETDFAIINGDFEVSKKIGQLGDGQKVFFSRTTNLAAGVWVEKQEIVFSVGSQTGALLLTNQVALRGEHNLENACAAAAACLVLGVESKFISQTLATFKGLEHRLELAGEKSGVRYYNDSYSTTPETAIAAVKSFSEPLILILGGSDKKADFTILAESLKEASNLKKVVLIGESGPKIEAALKKAKSKALLVNSEAATMAEILEQANKEVVPGDIVLLSPACASFGLFKNYKDRGQQFKNAVTKLNG